ncbi:hypothetical protein PHYPSEUDO_002409 [Phytophthora pseudosyringae]|uniref:Uncharacterized protein n=1 Tax=Phytophthora pseudosyringae TaxID=221518 RepID=A0A8T1VT95_9STRA|nr:hypothetical protein PHYPSEUDO_002409 [Phytophthora pseudosyringae]
MTSMIWKQCQHHDRPSHSALVGGGHHTGRRLPVSTSTGVHDSGRRPVASCGVTAIDNQRECSILEIASRNHDSQRAPPRAFVESDQQHVGQQRAASGPSVNITASKFCGRSHGGGIDCSGQIWK